MALRQIVAKNVSTLRKAKSLSQAQLAAHLQVNKQTVWRIESAASNIGMDTIERLAEVFGVAPSRLLHDASQLEPVMQDHLQRVEEVSMCLDRAATFLKHFRTVMGLKEKL